MRRVRREGGKRFDLNFKWISTWSEMNLQSTNSSFIMKNWIGKKNIKFQQIFHFLFYFRCLNPIKYLNIPKRIQKNPQVFFLMDFLWIYYFMWKLIEYDDTIVVVPNLYTIYPNLSQTKTYQRIEFICCCRNFFSLLNSCFSFQNYPDVCNSLFSLIWSHHPFHYLYF